MEKIINKEIGSITLIAEKGRKITNKGRTFYVSRVEIPMSQENNYEEVYYDDLMKIELEEEPEERSLTDEQIKQINDIQRQLKYLQEQLNDILK